MPKVSEKYLEQKRNDILDATLAVCLRKPLYEVSMRDVISETGLSQGGIYRYYSNLDEILVELINRESVLYDTTKLVDEALSKSEAPETVINKLIELWGRVVLDNLVGVGKIYYEIGIAYVNDEERLNNFISKILFAPDESYLWAALLQFITEKISEGYFKPKVSLESLICFHITSVDGITRDLILHKHYGLPMPMEVTFERENLLSSHCVALVLLLGGDETKIVLEEEK